MELQTPGIEREAERPGAGRRAWRASCQPVGTRKLTSEKGKESLAGPLPRAALYPDLPGGGAPRPLTPLGAKEAGDLGELWDWGPPLTLHPTVPCAQTTISTQSVLRAGRREAERGVLRGVRATQTRPPACPDGNISPKPVTSASEDAVAGRAPPTAAGPRLVPLIAQIKCTGTHESSALMRGARQRLTRPEPQALPR